MCQFCLAEENPKMTAGETKATVEVNKGETKRNKKRCEIYATQLEKNMQDVVYDGCAKGQIKKLTKGHLLDAFEPMLTHLALVPLLWSLVHLEAERETPGAC